MLVVFVRALLLYLVVVVVIRMMGKRQVAEMQPFELVIMIMIAELAATPMEDVGIPLINGVIPIIALLSIQVLISYFALKSEKFRDFICGKPSILIHKGRIDQSELRRLRVSINDLLEALRNKDYFNISDVEYAILETNGQMSIVPKADKRPVVISDLNSCDDIQDEELPVTLIVDGRLNDTKLRKAGYDKDWLMDQLRKQNIDNVESVFFAFLSSDRIFYAQEKKN
ncbi:DUF421 domain-containing protein [Alkaliphilus sp. MSJ-5]|uniref:DUF421 domain-containing protein n=1 Tax=Alkaliphilus flagellatus TaxID=2841507 RepID=A0ABS6G2S0_9FIRM|nr:DUF421 domain-containing protein [Alkaliphilus flagellatus]MBU5676778.1 DUF421 domain-containing protein [Alkaliphilus flagellatus]